MRPVNDEEVLRDIERRSDWRTQGWGAGDRLARDLDVDPSHLRQVKSGTRPISRKMATRLGWVLKWVKSEKVQP